MEKEAKKATEKTPFGQPVLVGKMAYQVFSKGYRGKLQYTARVGKPFISNDSGELLIISEIEDDTAADFLLAARAAKKQLRELAAQAFQQALQQRQANFTVDRSEPREVAEQVPESPNSVSEGPNK